MYQTKKGEGTGKPISQDQIRFPGFSDMYKAMSTKEQKTAESHIILQAIENIINESDKYRSGGSEKYSTYDNLPYDAYIYLWSKIENDIGSLIPPTENFDDMDIKDLIGEFGSTMANISDQYKDINKILVIFHKYIERGLVTGFDKISASYLDVISGHIDQIGKVVSFLLYNESLRIDYAEFGGSLEPIKYTSPIGSTNKTVMRYIVDVVASDHSDSYYFILGIPKNIGSALAHSLYSEFLESGKRGRIKESDIKITRPEDITFETHVKLLDNKVDPKVLDDVTKTYLSLLKMTNTGVSTSLSKLIVFHLRQALYRIVFKRELNVRHTTEFLMSSIIGLTIDKCRDISDDELSPRIIENYRDKITMHVAQEDDPTLYFWCVISSFEHLFLQDVGHWDLFVEKFLLMAATVREIFITRTDKVVTAEYNLIFFNMLSLLMKWIDDKKVDREIDLFRKIDDYVKSVCTEAYTYLSNEAKIFRSIEDRLYGGPTKKHIELPTGNRYVNSIRANVISAINYSLTSSMPIIVKDKNDSKPIDMNDRYFVDFKMAFEYVVKNIKISKSDFEEIPSVEKFGIRNNSVINLFNAYFPISLYNAFHRPYVGIAEYLYGGDESDFSLLYFNKFWRFPMTALVYFVQNRATILKNEATLDPESAPAGSNSMKKLRDANHRNYTGLQNLLIDKSTERGSKYKSYLMEQLSNRGWSEMIANIKKEAKEKSEKSTMSINQDAAIDTFATNYINIEVEKAKKKAEVLLVQISLDLLQNTLYVNFNLPSISEIASEKVRLMWNGIENEAIASIVTQMKSEYGILGKPMTDKDLPVII
jgi:hypothetical protein